MADAIAVQRSRAVTVGSPALSVTVEGTGDPLGTVLGTITALTTDTAAVAGAWTANDSRYESTTGPNSELKTPEEPDNHQIGFIVRTRRGTDTDIVRQILIPYGVPGNYEFVVATGERLRLAYTVPTDGTRPHFVLTVVQGPLGENAVVYLHEATASPDTALTQAEVNAIKTEQAHLQTEIDNIHQAPAGSPLPPNATEAEAEAGDGLFPRLWSPLRVFEAIGGYITRARLARVLGGYGLSYAVSGNTLSITHVRADGASETITYTPAAPSGGGGITADAARDVAGALLSTLSEFSYDASTDTLTYTPPAASRPTNITVDELSNRLQGLIANFLTARSSQIVNLQNFENSLRHETQIATGTLRQVLSNSLTRLGTSMWPTFAGDDDIRVEVEYGPDDNSVDFTFPASQLRAVSTQGTQADNTNSNRVSTSDNSYQFSVSNENGHIVVAADSPGDYVFTVFLTRTRVITAYIGDDQVTEPKLSPDVRTKLNEAHSQTGHTDAQIAAIADREAAKYVVNVDEVAHKDVQFSVAFAGRLAGESGIDNAALGFTANGVAYTIAQIIRRSNGVIAVTVTPIASQANLRGWELDIAGERHDFSGAEYNPGDASNADLYELAGPSAAFDTTNPTRVAVLEPPSTPLPRPTSAQEGYTIRSKNRKATWEKPTGGFKLLSGPGAGVAVTNHTSDSPTNIALTLFRPGGTGYFDLDLEDTDRFLFMSVLWTMTGRSSNSIGWDRSLTPPDSVRSTGFVHLQEIAALAAWTTTQHNGYEITFETASLGTDDLGVQRLWVGKDSQNRLGYWEPYSGGDAVASGPHNWNVGSVIRAYV